jgi:DNA topoisomerase-1
LLGNEPESGLPVYVRSGRFGSYVQLGEAGGKEKPRTGSLLKSMQPISMTLEDALQMLSLPRVVGDHPDQKQPITAQLGRYGPYISCGKDSRSLEKEEDVFSITLPAALVLLAQPKTRGQRKTAEPIKELGTDEFSGGVITLREGRFGLYVTDGETNASLRKDDSPEGIDNARAQELLHQRRERAPVKKKRAKKKAVVAEASSKASKKASSKAKAPPAASDTGADGDDVEPGSSKPAPAKKAKAGKKTAGKKLVAKKGGKAKGAESKSSEAKPKAAKGSPKKLPDVEVGETAE